MELSRKSLLGGRYSKFVKYFFLLFKQIKSNVSTTVKLDKDRYEDVWSTLSG